MDKIPKDAKTTAKISEWERERKSGRERERERGGERGGGGLREENDC